MIEKFKTAETFGMQEKIKLVAFVRGEYYKDSSGRPVGVKREITIYNLEQKPILKYYDIWNEYRNNSKIYCYENFFVRQVEDFRVDREVKLKTAYLVYDYSGKLLGKAKGLWLKQEWEKVEDWRE